MLDPADDFEAEILAVHGEAALRVVRRYLNPPAPKPKAKITSTEPPQPGRVFARGRVLRRRGCNDSR
jgi:hypothetical protein